AAAGLPAGDRTAIAPGSARSVTAPSTSPETAAPAVRASDIAAAFVASPPALAPPAGITIGLDRSTLAAVLPPEGAFLAAASPNGSERLAPYGSRPQSARSVATIDLLFTGADHPLAVEVQPDSGATLGDSRMPWFGAANILPEAVIDRVFGEEGFLLA